MGPRGWQYLIYSCLFWSAHGIIPEPQNVSIHSVTFNSTLLWDSPHFHEENVTYTVQYKMYPMSFKDLCIKTVLTECNISDLYIFGTHSLRVRTESEKGQSKWVDLTFNPWRDTIIGPPVVHAGTTKGVLHVEVADPNVTLNGSSWPIVSFYRSLIYSMLIWKEGYDEQFRNVNILRNSKTLSDLDPRTTYCFKIQALVSETNKRGQWTKVSCIKTDDKGEDPVQLAIIILSVLILFPFCCVMILHVYRWVKYAYFPSYSLPQHFKEFLGKPYGSDFLASQPHGDDYACEKITVVSEEQKNRDSEEQPNSSKEQQFQRSQGETPGLKEVEEDCTTLLFTNQTGGNNLLHSQGTYKASMDTLHITNLKIVIL